ncbi:alpha/beta-hydrolase [Cyathus striatus]|nr:alpha/beta-hydrolase [Cyathus striatus]
MSQTIETPFRISVPDEQLSLLKRKLSFAVFPDELEGAGRDYGVPLADMQRLVARWKDGYDWRKYEAELNEELPQFTQDFEVEGFGTFNLHYVHKKSASPNAIPLLFVHGWPGSFLEVRKILPLLSAVDDSHPTFHVVAPSLPGYGFSSAPTKKGFKYAQYAELFNKLMVSLGYNEYITQGGDLGSYITRWIASLYGGKHSKAWHTNYPRSPSAGPPSLFRQPLQYLSYFITPYTEAEKAGLRRTEWFQTQGHGYNTLQKTQPQTIGYAVTDSPVGLLAWIYEKLVNWSDGYAWEDDEVLTWISIYWFSRCGPAATFRVYYESAHGGAKFPENTTIPMGFSYFSKELYNVPRRWLKRPNLVFESEHERGGHFAAHENPEGLVGDLRRMFGKEGAAFGVVPGRTGF